MKLKDGFENDVNKYGTQARMNYSWQHTQFENDVNKYGIQTEFYGSQLDEAYTRTVDHKFKSELYYLAKMADYTTDYISN